jgi:hypothetical protein
MTKPEQSKNLEVKTLYRTYCKDHLNKNYLKICKKVYKELLTDEDIFKRGKANIWAAAIVWAVGSVNFLGDKSFEPYASLKDVCGFFNANTSTVGQKAAIIREMLDINQFNDEYVLEDSPIMDFLNNLLVTEEGLIVSRNIIESEEEAIVDEEVISDEDELPANYIVIVDANRNLKLNNLYEIEYLFKKVLSDDEQLKKVEFYNNRRIIIRFYGRPYKVLLFEKKLISGPFTVTDMLDDLLE